MSKITQTHQFSCAANHEQTGKVRTAGGVTLLPRSLFRRKEVGLLCFVTPPHQTLLLWNNTYRISSLHYLITPMLATLPSGRREFHAHRVPPLPFLVSHGPYIWGELLPHISKWGWPFPHQKWQLPPCREHQVLASRLYGEQARPAREPPPSWLRPD